MNGGKPALLAAGLPLGGFVLSALLVGVHPFFLGILATFTAVPLAFIAWVMAGDRYY